MIKGITPTGRYTIVSGGNASTPYISPGSAGAGMLRWNPNMNCMEVSDGNSWKMIEMSYASVGLNPEAESLLDWARTKRDEELAWQSLAEKNAAVKIALEHLEEARRQLDITAKLARDYDTETTS
jgi:hypothetical protein